jgi:hypothetical protein
LISTAIATSSNEQHGKIVVTGPQRASGALDFGATNSLFKRAPKMAISRNEMAALGAQRKHVTLPKGFRSPSENGRSRDG